MTSIRSIPSLRLSSNRIEESRKILDHDPARLDVHLLHQGTRRGDQTALPVFSLDDQDVVGPGFPDFPYGADAPPSSGLEPPS